MAIHRAFSYARELLWRLCVGDLRVCRFTDAGLAHLYTAATSFEVQANWC